MSFSLRTAGRARTGDLARSSSPLRSARGSDWRRLWCTRLKVPSFIVSLGMWYVGLGIAAVLFGQEMQPFLSDPNSPLWPTSAPHGVSNSYLVALGVVALGFLVERFTRLGRLPYAIGNN